MLFYSFRGYTDYFSKYARGIVGMLFENLEYFIPTFHIFSLLSFIFLPTISVRLAERGKSKRSTRPTLLLFSRWPYPNKTNNPNTKPQKTIPQRMSRR